MQDLIVTPHHEIERVLRGQSVTIADERALELKDLPPNILGKFSRAAREVLALAEENFSILEAGVNGVGDHAVVFTQRNLVECKDIQTGKVFEYFADIYGGLRNHFIQSPILSKAFKENGWLFAQSGILTRQDAIELAQNPYVAAIYLSDDPEDRGTEFLQRRVLESPIYGSQRVLSVVWPDENIPNGTRNITASLKLIS